MKFELTYEQYIETAPRIIKNGQTLVKMPDGFWMPMDDTTKIFYTTFAPVEVTRMYG